jgi:hypothetical protein
MYSMVAMTPSSARTHPRIAFEIWWVRAEGQDPDIKRKR